jgi:hypothetical protein
MASALIDGTNIDTSVLSYSAIKPNPTGGKVVNVYNKNVKESIIISTPLMLTWGAQEVTDQGQPTGKYTMSLQFPSEQYANEDSAAFLDGMKRLEKQIMTDAITYSKEWFGKEIKSMEVMEEKFNAMLKYPKKEKGKVELDFNKPPTITLKIPFWKNGGWQSEIFDEDVEPLFIKTKDYAHLSPIQFLPPKSHVITVIQCGGLWFVNGKVSITWNLKQAIVQKPKTSSIREGVCLLKPKKDDITKMKELPPPEHEEHLQETVSTTIVDNDDDDDEEEYRLPPPAAVAKPEPEPEPVVQETPAVAVTEEKKAAVRKVVKKSTKA